MITTIQKEIIRIEEEKNVKIWFAIESGSRAWGFPSEDSDYDVRFIYTHPQAWYLTIQNKRDVIEYPIDGELDLSGWDLKKALQLLTRSNPSLYEWLVSPIIYHADAEFTDDLLKTYQSFVSHKTLGYHYLSLARRNYYDFLDNKIEVNLKKYFYVLRGLFSCQYLIMENKLPTIDFNELLTLIDIPESIRSEIDILLIRKRSSAELKKEAPIMHLNQFIEARIVEYEMKLNTLVESNQVDYQQLDLLFQKYLK